MVDIKWMFLFIVLTSTIVLAIAIKLKMYDAQWPLIFMAPVIPLFVILGVIGLIVEDLKDRDKKFHKKITSMFKTLRAAIIGFPILVGITVVRISKVNFKPQKIKKDIIWRMLMTLFGLYKSFFVGIKQKNNELFKYA